MIRYVETFFRYWLIVLIPIIALPTVEYMQVRHLPHLYTAFTNIFVQQSVTDQSTSSNPFTTPAQLEQSNILQWLQSATFDLAVAKGSPLYARALTQSADPLGAAFNDLSKNVSASSKGDNLLTISYTTSDPVLAMQVLNSVLKRTSVSSQTVQAQVTDQQKRYDQYRLFQAEKQERNSASALADYMQQHNVTTDNLNNLLGADPTLATLYEQNRSDHEAVVSLQNKIQSLDVTSSLPSGLVNQDGFVQMDPPSYASASNRKKVILDLAIAVVLALLLACSFLVVMTALDRSIRRPEEVPPMLDLPVLAIVPYGVALAQRPLPASSTGRQRQVAKAKGVAAR